MAKTSLVAVHPGYYQKNGRYAFTLYGDHDAYMLRLAEAVRSQPSALLLFRKDAPPKGLQDATHIFHDPEGLCDTSELVPALRKDGVERITVGGEFLWYNAPDINKNLKEYSERLPLDKKEIFQEALRKANILDSRFARRVGVDPDEFVQEVFLKKSAGIRGGCVSVVYRDLRENFRVVEIDRALCYPTIDPQILSRKNPPTYFGPSEKNLR